MSRICREPGVTVRSSSAGSERPRRTAATRARSSYEEFTELPTQTCRVPVPSASRTGTTFPGEDGSAISGSSSPRSISSASSYSAPVVGGELDELVPASLRSEPCARLRRRSGRSRSSRRSPSPCCRSSRGRSRSASRRPRRGTRRSVRAHRARRAAAATRARRPWTAPRAEPAAQLDADDERPLDRIRPAGHRDRDLGRPRADREHPERAGHRRVAVGAEQHLPRTGEALEVQVVGDPVARAGSTGRRTAPPSCAGTRGPRGSCCRTGGRCGRRTRPSAARPGRGRAARTGGRPSSRSRPRAGSGRPGARSPPPSRRPGGRR